MCKRQKWETFLQLEAKDWKYQKKKKKKAKSMAWQYHKYSFLWGRGVTENLVITWLWRPRYINEFLCKMIRRTKLAFRNFLSMRFIWNIHRCFPSFCRKPTLPESCSGFRRCSVEYTCLGIEVSLVPFKSTLLHSGRQVHNDGWSKKCMTFLLKK